MKKNQSIKFVGALILHLNQNPGLVAKFWVPAKKNSKELLKEYLISNKVPTNLLDELF
jgi:hypothetical protein